jgi:hypothetical protein
VLSLDEGCRADRSFVVADFANNFLTAILALLNTKPFRRMKKYIYLFVLTVMTLTVYGQNSAVQTLALEDMSAFRSQAGNWQIVGDVVINPAIDIHQHEQPATKPPDDQKKKKKSKQPVAVAEVPKAVTFSSGKGILLNMNDESKKDHLLTNFEHGDIELELEVMLPKGSNSGIYLQGRYEVQLLDSWGVRNPGFGDIGGIYRNWENQPGKIYMGKAPLTNAAKAPGLWQKMKISFRAPKFDPSGKKIANARFISVELNGVKIHDNVEVPLPTGGPIENNEKATGPLMIQGDHGPVAFRNIKYRLMKEGEFALSDITYKTYYGNFKTVSDYASLKPAATGSLTELTCEMLESENAYGVAYTGNFTAPEDAEYEFTIMFTGGGKFTINNQELVNLQRPDGWIWENRKITLKAGTYPFEIQNFKDAGWMPPRLGLFVQTQNTYAKALHAFNSFPPDDQPASPILLNPGSGPKLLRAFIDFKGDRKQRLTHTIGVGEPSGINYVYDLQSGNLVCVWRGDFVDATPMWHDRGDGSFRPLGAPQFLVKAQPLAYLQNENDAFPSQSNENEFRSKGYILDANTSRPVFKFTYRGMEVEDRVYPEDENRLLTHDVQIKSGGGQPGLYYKIADGSQITKVSEGLYAIGDKEYYIKITDAVKPLIRDGNGARELVIPMQGSSFKYSIIW